MFQKNKTLIYVSMLLIYQNINSQEKEYPHSIDLDYSIGQTLIPKEKKFDTKSSNLTITYNRNTFGDKEWQRNYNFPSYGVMFSYQKNNEPILGDVYSLMLHYTHYLYKRKLAIKIADGPSLSTNPYHMDKNKENVYVTSKLSNGFQLSLLYKEDNVWDRFGFHVGATFTHYSNGATKVINKGLNSYFIEAGINYSLGEKEKEFIYEGDSEALDKKIHYNLVYRDGFNQNSTQTDYDYLKTISFFVDKRLDKKRALQVGIDYFSSDFLKNLSKKNNEGKKINTDRIGVFVGHDLIIDKLHIPVQLGYYFYNPAHYKKHFYQRIGAKYYVHKNVFMGIALKTHLSQAEAIEYSLGIKL